MQADPLSRLSEDVIDFENRSLLTLHEKELCNKSLLLLQRACRMIDNECVLSVFGSYATGLSTKGSDIDVTVSSKHPNFLAKLHQLATKSKEEFRSSQLIRARVSICRVRTINDVFLDVNCQSERVSVAVNIIKGYLNEFPQLRPIYITVKSILKWYQLNQVFTGGLSSISLQYMIVQHLQLYNKHFNEQIQNVTIGALLRDFFLFYGKHFEHGKVSVDVQKKDFNLLRSGLLCIWDPTKKLHNVASGSYRYTVVRDLFAAAGEYLSSETRPTLSGLSCYLQENFFVRQVDTGPRRNDFKNNRNKRRYY
ncbi:poly(A) RNA polymerase protein [Acrasis kona]|uniref:Poly(A) RNA polymerase protein n=1 Tax=Acrasis kona TaxID=1008807 RepID=A0AAW2Z531_9EUKA